MGATVTMVNVPAQMLEFHDNFMAKIILLSPERMDGVKNTGRRQHANAKKGNPGARLTVFHASLCLSPFWGNKRGLSLYC